MSRPLAVCISDIHFSVPNLELASKALLAAVKRSAQLQAPLIIAGDLNDTKAIIRAEVANRLIEILITASQPVYILAGNHDLINEKGIGHGLNYLRPYASVVDKACALDIGSRRIYLIPYQTSPEYLAEFVKWIDPGTIVIMHQGVSDAFMGDYVVDKSALDVSHLKHLTCISGHYHRHQTIGTLTYIGSPYTMSFGEANDGPKGFLVLNDDGSFTREILDLRRHVIIERTTETVWDKLTESTGKDDLIWLKVTGPASELNALKKSDLAEKVFFQRNFKFDRIYTDTPQVQETTTARTPSEMIDALIDNSGEPEGQRAYLKALYREIMA